jgi:hypothetical protein
VSQPFLLITPLGRLDPKVARTFDEHGVRPLELRLVADYPRTATKLYARAPSTPERDRVQLAYEDTWRNRVSDLAAELWLLDERAFEAAWELKPRLRAEWPAETVSFGARTLWLRSFHLPDPDDVAREWALLR